MKSYLSGFVNKRHKTKLYMYLTVESCEITKTFQFHFLKEKNKAAESPPHWSLSLPNTLIFRKVLTVEVSTDDPVWGTSCFLCVLTIGHEVQSHPLAKESS